MSICIGLGLCLITNDRLPSDVQPFDDPQAARDQPARGGSDVSHAVNLGIFSGLLSPEKIKTATHRTGPTKLLHIYNNAINGNNVLLNGSWVQRDESGTEWGLWGGTEQDWHINTVRWYGNTYSGLKSGGTNELINENGAVTPYTSEAWFSILTS